MYISPYCRWERGTRVAGKRCVELAGTLATPIHMTCEHLSWPWTSPLALELVPSGFASLIHLPLLDIAVLVRLRMCPSFRTEYQD
jgi:hypothetical protein